MVHRLKSICFSKKHSYTHEILYANVLKVQRFKDVFIFILICQAKPTCYLTASPTFPLTDILIRGRQTNSQVIVSGVPFPPRQKQKGRLIAG